MAKHSRKHLRRRRVVQAALGRLGWHAKGKDVVALLGDYGVACTESLVAKVKLEQLKRSDEVRVARAKARATDRRATKPLHRKVPQPRHHRGAQGME